MNETLPSPRDHAQAYALTFPGAYEEHPWGETVIKVTKKVFLFVNGAIAPEDGVSLSVKLPARAPTCSRCPSPSRWATGWASTAGSPCC